MITITEAYQCKSCLEWYDDPDDARECCSPGIADGWRCSACGEYYSAEIDAKNCCAKNIQEAA